MRWLLLLLLYTGSLLAEPTARLLHTLEGGLQLPSALALDDQGNAWVLDGPPRRVVRFDARGKPLGAFPLPAPTDRPPLPATDLAHDGRRLYVADPGYGRILVLDRQGKLLRTLRPRPGGKAAEPVSVLPAGQWLWWSDRRNHRLCRTRLEAPMETRCVGKRGSARNEFLFPYLLARDEQGYLLVTDVLNGRVQVRSPGGDDFGVLGRFGTRPGELYRPNGITRIGNTVAVSDAYLGTVTLFRQRLPLGPLQDPQGDTWRFDLPVGLASRDQRLYVVEMGAHRVQVLELTALPSTPLPTPPPQPSRRDCLICHLSWAEDPAPKQPASLLPVSSPRMCMSCHHGAVVESRHRLGRGHQHPTLELRHDGEPAGDTSRFQEDEVPADYPLSPEKRLYCGSCHTPHDRPEGGKALHPGHRNPWLRKANPNGELCSDCHASKARQEAGKPANHPLGIRLRPPPHPGAEGYPRRKSLQQGLPESLAALGARLGEEDRLICQTCHQVHGAGESPLLVAREEASRLCIACHRDQHAENRKAARRKGLHPATGKLEKPVELGGRRIRRLDCLACHRVHDGEPDTPLLPRGTNAKRLCRECHRRQHARDQEQAGRKGIHPLNLALDPPVELAGKKIERLECPSCHSVHEGVANTPALVLEHRDGALCKACHEEHLAVARTDHDLRDRPRRQRNGLKQPFAEAGLCGACHSMHRGGGKAPFLYCGPPLPEAKDSPVRDRLCLACHRKENPLDARVVEKYDHPWRDLILRSDPKVMPLLDEAGEIAEFGRIGCITCHEPHRWHAGKTPPPAPVVKEGNEEGSVLSSFLRRKGVAGAFCVDCHGPEAHYKYKFFHDEAGREKGLDYIR